MLDGGAPAHAGAIRSAGYPILGRPWVRRHAIGEQFGPLPERHTLVRKGSKAVQVLPADPVAPFYLRDHYRRIEGR